MANKFWKDTKLSEIVFYLDKNLSNKEIIEKLGCSERSYFYYLEEIRNKFPREKTITSIEGLLQNKDWVIEESIKAYGESYRNSKPEILKTILRAIESKEKTLERIGIIPKEIETKIIKQKEE